MEWKEKFRENCFVNWGIPHKVDLFFGNFKKMLFHSLMTDAENSKRTFWLNEKRPMPKKY